MHPSTPPPSSPGHLAPAALPDHPVLVSALLGILEEAALGVLTLCEDLQEQELLGSRLTRAEVLRLLRRMADSALQLPPGSRQAMPEIDWDGWTALGTTLKAPAGPALDDALWFAVRALVPATVMWLRVYRQAQPARFQMKG